MKKSLFVLLCAVILLSCNNNKSINKSVFDENSSQEILIGKCNINGFKQEPFNIWYTDEYSKYQVDMEALSNVAGKDMHAIKIEIVLGTWCHDSQREVPRFMKILERINFPENQYEIICVNSKKKVDGIDINTLNIKRVPTFIFYFDNNEIGRIVESPAATLEKDIAEIMKNY